MKLDRYASSFGISPCAVIIMNVFSLQSIVAWGKCTSSKLQRHVSFQLSNIWRKIFSLTHVCRTKVLYFAKASKTWLVTIAKRAHLVRLHRRRLVVLGLGDCVKGIHLALTTFHRDQSTSVGLRSQGPGFHCIETTTRMQPRGGGWVREADELSNNLINDVTRSTLFAFEDDHVARDYHVPRKSLAFFFYLY